jgi:hypothetical protein
MSVPRIHVMADTTDLHKPNACAALRLLDPFLYPGICGNFDISFGAGPPDGPVDLMVMQRFGRMDDDPAAIEDMLISLKASGTRLLYDIDDNLIDPHPDAASERAIAPRRRNVRLLLREADHVTVSTEPLAERVRGLNPRVTVLPNALDERRFAAEPVAPGMRERLTIGYFGTFTHLRDLMSVVGPLRAALSRLPQRARIEVCGITQDTRILSLFEDVATVEVLPATGDYESFVQMMLSRARWDIGLAPLATGAFERTKSDIKFLEYAAFGIAGLYSDHPAYAAVRHGETGLVAAPAQWADSLMALATDAGLRAAIAQRARDYLVSQRVLARSSSALAAVLDQLVSSPAA